MLVMVYWLNPHSLYPGFFPLFISTFYNPLPERPCLTTKFNNGICERIKDTGWMGMREKRRVGREVEKISGTGLMG